MKPSTKQLAAVLFAVILVASLAVLFFETRGATPASPIRVACVGDSITSDTEYTEILSEMLGDGYRVMNFGVGRTTVSLQADKPYLNQTELLYVAERFNPDIVVIMLGTNDAFFCQERRCNFVDDYKLLISNFQSLSSHPKIYIVIPPPAFNNTIGLPPEVLDNEIIPLINQTAIDLNLPTIDVHTPLLNSPNDFEDGVHPNVNGSEVIATEIYNAIT
ncbi:MAG: GDSL-type esterase/lipase family protein [Candidatus Bathyarchaeota archaeon]|nr:GDSL-type esterase/lipase family protein [Candidatus Bathyarchaeota archaeon]